MYERLTESEQVARYRDVHKRLWYPDVEVEKPEYLLPDPEYQWEPTPLDASWVLTLKCDAARAANRKRRIFISDCIEAVCEHFHVTRRDITSDRRNRSIVRPRQIGMYYAKLLTKNSLPEIGRRFGNRDHTTVLHAFRKITQLIETDQEIRKDVEAIGEALGQ